MIDGPENVTLEWLGRTLAGMVHELRAMRNDLDMLTRMVIRVDHTVDALREDIRSLWSLLNARNVAANYTSVFRLINY